VHAAWLTDIHLEFLEELPFKRFLAKLASDPADCFLISGDIAVSPTVAEVLADLVAVVKRPLYFVLGNHDYYQGSIAETREGVGIVAEKHRHLHWLSRSEPVRLTETTTLVGHDSWGDGRLGNPRTTPVMLNDFELIRELRGLSRAELIARLNSLGDEAALHLRGVLPRALSTASHVVVLCHVPPFAEAAWYQGRPSGPDWLPFFSCKAVGDVLSDVMRENPGKNMTVLCGHTHGKGSALILPNLEVTTGGAQYGKPRIQKSFDWD
jgi:3',5'-cyclic-AMP phosphodiesterase